MCSIPNAVSPMKRGSIAKIYDFPLRLLNNIKCHSVYHVYCHAGLEL